MSGEPHVRIDRGRLEQRSAHGEAEHAPARKHAGLSLPDLQMPSRPAAYLTTRAGRLHRPGGRRPSRPQPCPLPYARDASRSRPGSRDWSRKYPCRLGPGTRSASRGNGPRRSRVRWPFRWVDQAGLLGRLWPERAAGPLTCKPDRHQEDDPVDAGARTADALAELRVAFEALVQP